MTNPSNEPHWLVKDFDVLYRASLALIDRLDDDLATGPTGLDSEGVASAAGHLRGQLQRLAPAWGEVLVMKASLRPTVAVDLEMVRANFITADKVADRAAGKGD